MGIRHLIILVISTILAGLFTYNLSYADCVATFQGTAAEFLQGCAEDKNVGIDPSWAGRDSMHNFIINIAEGVISFGALFAIGAIVYSGVQYTIAYGDDEKVKKAKMTGIYAIIGLLLLLIAFPMVNVVIDFIYDIGSN